MTRKTATRIGALGLLVFIGLLFYWVNERRAKDVELVYDLSRVGRTDLVALKVQLRQSDGALARATDFYYPAGEGRAPTQQRHRTKLGAGAYVVRFQMRFAKTASSVRETKLTLPSPEPVVVAVPPAD